MDDSSKDSSFPEHLRTIHFSLVIACLALLIAATSYRERALDTAVDDIDRISGVFPVVVDGQWLKRETDKLLSTRPVPAAISESWRVIIPAKLLSARIRQITKGNSLVAKLEIEEATPYTLIRGVHAESIRVGVTPDPLKQFGDWKKMWDEMQSVQVCLPHIVGSNAWFISGTPATLTSIPIESWEDAKDNPPFFRTQRLELRSVWKELSQPLSSNGSIAVVSPDVRLAFVGSAVQQSVSTRITMQGQDLTDLLHSQDAIPVAMIPVKCETFDLRSQSVLTDQANKKWSPGSFAQTFPDLAALSEGLDALQPEQVGKILRNLRERTGKEVEVSGLKVPLEVITRWGLVLIVGIQLYFWLDLRNFLRRTVSPGTLDVPWLGLYRDGISRFIFWTSSVMLPIATVCLLMIKGVLGVEGWSHRLFFGALSGSGPVASILLGAMTAGLVRSLGQLKVTEPPQAEDDDLE